MICLSINTATARCDLALVGAGGVIAERAEAMPRGQDAALPGAVDSLLAEGQLGWGDVARITVVAGPGSFTGVRIGVAYARGLALVLGRPCLGLTSLEAAVDPHAHPGPVRVALQAQRRPPDLTFWVQDLGPQGPSGPPMELALADLEKSPLPILTDRPDLVAGGQGPVHPHAAIAGLRARTLDPQARPPVPAYVRAPDAALPGGDG